MSELEKQGDNGKFNNSETPKNIKVMMISMDIDAYLEFLKNPKVGASLPPINVTCDFLWNKVLCYAMLEGARDAIHDWNELQIEMQNNQPKKHGILDYLRGRK